MFDFQFFLLRKKIIWRKVEHFLVSDQRSVVDSQSETYVSAENIWVGFRASTL